jgi:uncharacterized membrane protein
MFALAIVGVCIILAATGQLYMKKGMNVVNSDSKDLISSQGLIKIIFNKYVFTGLALYGIGTILWLFALAQLDLSLAYPLISIGYILTAVLAFVFLNEKITLLRWGGIALVVLGSLLIIKSG